ncbi:carbohydrate ABC transporter permease [Melioribacteraceae bacterium 4301-Me]|uniref:carbohydrate ABC transporter permease n=1 Tax=Pyranulibacter aquaticus TaxID=3163344 RepID=UPI003596A0C9
MKVIKNIFINSETQTAYLFNLPLVITTIIFIFLPVVGTIITSLFRDVTYLPGKFLLFANYKRALSDPHFWQSVQFTLLFVFFSVSFELLLGLVFALLLNETIPGKGFLRVVVLIPWAVPVAISARVWQLIYHFDYGLLNYFVLKLGISNDNVNWLGSSAGAFISIVLSDVWKTTPFITIILLAGLSTIPKELYEQAEIDGTNFLQRFFKITLPLIKPVIVVALLFRTIDAIRIFDLIYVLTGGGPGGSTTSISLYAYNYFASGDFGYGSAVSVIVFILAAVLAVLYMHFGQFREVIK